MNYAPESLPDLKAINISALVVGDIMVNLGPVLEIIENDNHFSLIIDRMEQKQIWSFNKTEEVFIKSYS
ncbi:hypothetical protein CPT03_00715 [Pedobacter ginsengisoli]|uniref:Uncharacterized protein n=1 Tax=Pedobacter ginsengisoli TaxID=363852 RepID=A0A2D1U0D8_9SPHI|nr:hypothetical protein [Pedobacter ginsengisoli]ATP55092.1 hypothetical protein CPT03_00715 [Pedobacter ginsengisoli]